MGRGRKLKKGQNITFNKIMKRQMHHSPRIYNLVHLSFACDVTLVRGKNKAYPTNH